MKHAPSMWHKVVIHHVPSVASIAVASLAILATVVTGSPPAHIAFMSQVNPLSSSASNGVFSASPNPIQVCSGSVGTTMLSWNTPVGTPVEIRLGGETGQMVAQATQPGTKQVTGVASGSVFNLYQIAKSWRFNKIKGIWEQAVVRVSLSQVIIRFTQDGCVAQPPSPVDNVRAAGNVRGVTFFYLDGVAQDFPWVLQNQYDPAVRAKIDATLAAYREAGVNWIRLLVSANHSSYYRYLHKANPIPEDSLVRQVNDFMAITRAGENAGKFTIELMLIAETGADGRFKDIAPYTKDKQWYASWISRLNYSNLGLLMFGGDLQPCGWEPSAGFQCGNASSRPEVQNNAAWIVEMWNWHKQNYPKLNVNYEVIGGGDIYGMMLSTVAKWQLQNTPDIPATAAGIYFDLAPGSTWQQYAETTRTIIAAYKAVSTKPLWIDEYGKSLSNEYSVTDQVNFTAGFLGTAICGGYGTPAGLFGWVAGYDSVYNGQVSFGLASGFSGNTPVWRPAWNSIKQYYTLTKCL